MKQINISSLAFKNNGPIPEKYTCDGLNMNPPLDFKNIPEETKCLALIVDDPDAPINTWVHWIVWNIQVTNHLKENNIPGEEGINDFQQHKYGGPCPPSGTHHYLFKIYALDTLLVLPANSKKSDLEKAMNGHMLAYGELIGLYQRK